MIQASQLKQMTSRALVFSDRKAEAGQRATLERQNNVLHLSASDGNSAIRIFRDDVGDNFETVVNIYAFDEILNCFKTSDLISIEVDPSVKKQIIISTAEQIYNLPIYPTLEVYNIPKPGHWEPVSSKMNSVIQRSRDWPIKSIKTLSNLPLVFMFDNQNVGIISGHLSFFERIEETLQAQIPLTQLIKVSDAITHYFLTSGHIYFNGPNEWCMIPLDTRKLVSYQILLDLLQKQNIYGISITVSELLGITSKIRSMKKAEEILAPDENQAVQTRFTPNEMMVSTSLGNVCIPVASNDAFVSIECKASDLFYQAIGHRAFLCENEKIEILIGPQMSFIVAQVGTGKVLGGLFRA